MDRHPFPVVGNKRQIVVIDLDDRTPLTDTEAAALSEALNQAVLERQRLNDSIRKMTQRLTLSAEAKVKEMRDGS